MKKSLKLQLFITISILVSLTLFATGMAGYFAIKNEIKEVFDADMAESAKLILKIAKHNPNQNFLAEEDDELQKLYGK